MESIICSVCKTAKPRKDFKRMATLTQTRAWLRNPLATKCMTYVGKDCNDCHKQTKRKTNEITPAELRKRLVNEGLHPLLVEERIAKRRALGSKKKSASARRVMRQWHKQRKEGQQP